MIVEDTPRHRQLYHPEDLEVKTASSERNLTGD